MINKTVTIYPKKKKRLPQKTVTKCVLEHIVFGDFWEDILEETGKISKDLMFKLTSKLDNIHNVAPYLDINYDSLCVNKEKSTNGTAYDITVSFDETAFYESVK